MSAISILSKSTRAESAVVLPDCSGVKRAARPVRVRCDAVTVARAAPIVAVVLAALAWTGSSLAAAGATIPTQWCGNDRASASRTPDVELSSAQEIHVLYALPADGADRFASLATPIASDVAAMDAWWRAQDPTRTLRFDLFAFPGCGTRYGDLDLGFARLPRPGSAYLGNNRGGLLIGDLVSLAPPQTKTLVYYDGPVPQSERFVCGFSSRAATSGGQFGFSFVFLQSACPVDLGRGAFTARVTVHELIHGLGATPDVGPPHICPDPENAGHPCDSQADILYPFVTVDSTLDGALLDVGRDDYYGHSGSWWDVQDSAWLIHLPQFPLRLSVAGAGGRVTTEPGGLACTSTCSGSFDNGRRVRLVATPAAGARFTGWSGACSGAGDCVLAMDRTKSATARFGAGSFSLAVRVSGSGRVTSAPAGIACPPRCSARFAAERPVRLRAAPRRGSRFTGWSGDCRGRAACTVRLDGDRSVHAGFRRG
jgi:Divergent InlB B-repeat domain